MYMYCQGLLGGYKMEASLYGYSCNEWVSACDFHLNTNNMPVQHYFCSPFIIITAVKQNLANSVEFYPSNPLCHKHSNVVFSFFLAETKRSVNLVKKFFSEGTKLLQHER